MDIMFGNEILNGYVKYPSRVSAGLRLLYNTYNWTGTMLSDIALKTDSEAEFSAKPRTSDSEGNNYQWFYGHRYKLLGFVDTVVLFPRSTREVKKGKFARSKSDRPIEIYSSSEIDELDVKNLAGRICDKARSMILLPKKWTYRIGG